MKRFLQRIALFCGVLLLTLLGGMIVPRFTPHQNLHYALKDKHELLEKTTGPRIILVGGSNLAFGIDSRMISKSFGMPVVNTSIHAGMGLKYILEDIVRYIRPNDIVILSSEYDNFYGGAVWGYEPMISSIFAIPENLKLMNLENWRELITGVSKEAIRNVARFVVNVYRKILDKPSNGIYDRDSYNRFGDVEKHYHREPETFPINDIDPDFNPVSIDVINQFRDGINHIGADLFVTYPCLNRGSFDLYPKKIAKIQSEFQKNGFQLLGTPDKYSFDDSLYYNSKYHLEVNGIKLRTELLIGDLRNALKKQP